jgi:tellurite methyltransferase
MTLPGDPDKWNRVYASADHVNLQAAKVLKENTHLLPAQDQALDVACGLGANALLMAQHGLAVCAWDISKIAIDKLIALSSTLDCPLSTEVRDITIDPPAPKTFDVIIVSHFLERSIIPELILALRDDGLIFYQTFIRDKIGTSSPRNPECRLRRNELISLFESLHIV